MEVYVLSGRTFGIYFFIKILTLPGSVLYIAPKVYSYVRIFYSVVYTSEAPYSPLFCR